VIPDAAVERDALVAIILDEDNYTYADWTPEVDVDAMADALMSYVLLVKAEAWEEGRNADDFSVSIGYEKNPYRSQA